MESSRHPDELHRNGAVRPLRRLVCDWNTPKSPRADPRSPRLGVSPEFRLRPSLSVCRERDRGHASDVSPEFRLRPSLSAHTREPKKRAWLVSPKFRLRPSLSERERGNARNRLLGCRRSSDSGLAALWGDGAQSHMRANPCASRAHSAPSTSDVTVQTTLRETPVMPCHRARCPHDCTPEQSGHYWPHKR